MLLLKQKPRILIVDDEEHIRSTLHRWFYLRGFDADQAQDGAEAVEKCANNEYDVITMDLEMPRMNGAEAIAIIRRTCPGLPIVLLTGYSQDSSEEVFHCVSKVLTKPLSLHQIEAEIRAVLPSQET
jgi:CheY-like chemotaxis protein